MLSLNVATLLFPCAQSSLISVAASSGVRVVGLAAPPALFAVFSFSLRRSLLRLSLSVKAFCKETNIKYIERKLNQSKRYCGNLRRINSSTNLPSFRINFIFKWGPAECHSSSSFQQALVVVMTLFIQFIHNALAHSILMIAIQFFRFQSLFHYQWKLKRK